ncbi:ATP-binding cassette domain-containing protein [Streptomyces sp. NPDC002896]|uniref:ATP-binding cassette domain-containing protein n=1 Tax=Streptomyces sp. NPDC002896 TaxID=3154438 RepID=UPI0033294D05
MRGLADRLSRLIHRYENLRLARHMLALSFRAAPVVAVVNIVLILLLAGGTALTALAQRQLVDAAGRHAMTAVLVAALLGVLAHAGSFALAHVQGEVRQDLTVRVARELDHEVLGLTARIPTVEHLERPEFLDRLTALRRGTQALAASVWRAALGAASLLSLVLSVVLLAGIHPALVLLVPCALPTVVLAGRGRAHYRSVLDDCTQHDRLERELHALCLKPEPAKEVRIAGSGPVLDRRARALWDDTSLRLVRARARAVAYEAAGWLVFVAAVIAALAYALHLYARDRASLGDLVLLLSLALALSNQIANVLFNLGSVADAGHVTRHYLWLHTYAETAARADGRPAPERLEQGIQLRGLTFAYPGADGTPILKDVDLDLPAGSTLGLVGINGAGKSTLVKLLTGMYEPTAGEIRVDGTPLSSLAPASWSARCSGTLQDFAKLEFLARESVGVGDLPRIDDRDAVAGAVERAGARPLVDGLPQGLDTQLGTVFEGADLSHGQWQKLALARGLLRTSPLLLVLDEPTSALDPQAEHELFEQFIAHAREAARERGAITVLVSHRFSTVHMTDRIAVIDGGRVVEYGTHAELLAAGGAYAELYSAQARAYA